MAIEDNAEFQLPVQPPNQGTTTPGGWWQQNAPPGSYNTGISGYGGPGGYTGGLQQTMPVPMTGGAPGGQGPSQWTPESLNAYFASRGVTPNPNSVNYWLSKKAELDARGQEIGDPNYANMRLGLADEFGGGYGGHGAGQGGGTPLSQMGMDPGYQFRLGEGLKGIERGAASKGTLLTGGLQKGLQRYAQDYASGEFGNIFNRNLDLAKLGLAGTGGYSDAAQNYGNMAGGYVTGAGNAGASGTIGSSNAWTGTLGNIGNTANTAAILAQMRTKAPYQPSPQSWMTSF